MAGVELRNINKQYGHLRVTHDVNIDVRDGEFLVLVGPSGCGKSTLLRMIAGLEEITEGTVSIGGRVVNDISPKERDIAMVFQNYALYPHMTVHQNMGFSLKLRGEKSAEIDRRVREAAQILGLADYLERFPKQLSGGQRQRVAMGRAIGRNPQVCLFDEPLSNLDAKLRVVMRGEIRALQQRLGTTAIYVTHDQVEAMTMADRIVVMRDGRVEQIGTPLELYDHPINLHVAGFIGSPAMNFVDGHLEVADGGLHVRVNADCRLRLPAGKRGEAGRAVSCGFRPEHVALTETGPIPGRVATVEMNGAFTTLLVDVEGRQLTVQTTERPRWTRGDAVYLTPRTECLHLFDAETGDCLGAQPR